MYTDKEPCVLDGLVHAPKLFYDVVIQTHPQVTQTILPDHDQKYSPPRQWSAKECPENRNREKPQDRNRETLRTRQ